MEYKCQKKKVMRVNHFHSVHNGLEMEKHSSELLLLRLMSIYRDSLQWKSLLLFR